jgi:serine/threonine protein kinase
MAEIGPGTKVGNYEITGVIGRGGMGKVYSAYQPSLKREVAIKVVRPDSQDVEAMLKRFEREVAIVGNLNHPRILKVHDYGAEGELVYLVMEWQKGGNLAALVRQQAMPLEAALPIFRQLAEALDYAHRQGIIHRDLKPENVLLDAEQANIYLTDFGIAKAANSLPDLADLTAMTALTLKGSTIGTPSYMPPEQWQGIEADNRSDLYALGVMLFEMLSGRLPFMADTPFVLMNKHISETPPLLASTLPSLTPAIDKVLQKALAKDRTYRFSSAAEMVKALEIAVTGQTPPGLDIPVGRPARSIGTASSLAYNSTAVAFSAKKRSPALGAAAILVALALGVFGGVLLTRPPATEPTPTAIANAVSTQTATQTTSSTASPTPSRTFTPSITPSPTFDAQGSATAIIITITAEGFTSTPDIVAIANVIATGARLTQTAALWTPTPTPTFTYTPTFTPTFTATFTKTFTPSKTFTRTYTPTPTSTLPPQLGSRFTDTKGVEMVYVPAGQFIMGSDDGQGDEKPAHEQTISAGFWLDLTPLTNAQYAAFVADGGYQKQEYWTVDGWAWRQSNNIISPEDYDGFTDPDQPRVGISWYEAYAYGQWRGVRLPTEAEWEWAVRGPDSFIYPWGDKFIDDIEVAIWDGNGNGKPTKVGANTRQRGASWVGALDMAGNVWQWTSSLFGTYPYRATDGRENLAAGGSRVFRGGSWASSATELRSAYRDYNTPDARRNFNGVRYLRPL